MIKTGYLKRWRKPLLHSFLLAVILLTTACFVDLLYDRSQRGFEGRLGINFPQDAKIVGLQRDIFGFDGSRSWLVQLRTNSAINWNAPGDFREFPFNEELGDDYEYMRRSVLEEFPGFAQRFQRPRVWRSGLGGKRLGSGKRSIVLSDDGILIWFTYFWD